MSEQVTDDVIAAAIAFEAGQLLLGIRLQLGPWTENVELSTADLLSNELITQRILERFPDDAILSEEATDDLDRLRARRVWIVDPLDGTREYHEADRDDWAVHVALVEDGELRVGAVALPARAELFSTAMRFPNDPPTGDPIRIAVSRTRPPREADRLREELGAVLVAMGSAGAKAMAVLRGDVDAYIHAGGQYEWDSAAPIAIATFNGLHTSRIGGTAFEWNQESPWQPDLLICRSDARSQLLGLLSSGGGGSESR